LLVLWSSYGRGWDWWTFAYDLGVGVGIATAVSVMVSMHLKNFDLLQKARHDALKRELKGAVRGRPVAEDEGGRD